MALLKTPVRSRVERAGAATRSCDPIDVALAEDIGAGDITSRHFIGSERRDARIFARQRAVVAGAEVAADVFRRVDPRLRVKILRRSGQVVKRNETVLEVRGALRTILTAERVALNFLQRLSGIATVTRRFVDAVGRGKTRILDTRKTTPGLRALEKAAVVAGGGTNHRFGLYDMVLLKDNHLRAANDLRVLQGALRRLRRERPDLRVEIEAETLDQVRDFLSLTGIDVILLDNMSLATMRQAVRLGAGRMKFEASGRMTLTRVRAVAATGVDFISVGALTHSAPAIDFSLEIVG